MENINGLTKECGVRVLIAIPVYNERKYVDPVLNRVKVFHPDILVIDDGSTDGTQALLAARKDIQLITHSPNQGYGQSLIDAFNWADSHGYDWVITMDCDEQHEPEMIPSFIKEIHTDRWDLISGSRYLNPSKDDDLPPGDRRSINATITEVVNSIFNLRITDAFCGFKAHRVAPTVALKLDEKGYAFPMQLWPRAARAGLRLSEIPVRLIYNDPNRYFGGKLDDATYRLKHYLSVLQAELERFDQRASEPAACSGCGCG